ncbi:MAG: hypothetical protein WD844_17620 [Thermoleophilaceae bacterium]
MTARRHIVLLLAALALALATAAPAAAEPHVGYASESETRWDQFMTAPELAQDAEAIGFRSQVVIVDWEFIQRGGPESFDWSHYDKVRDAFAARGIRPFFEISFTPLWAADLGEWQQRCAGTTSWRQCGYRLPPATNRIDDWSRFVTELMRRYADWQPLGVGVWNEANSWRYWKTGPDPARYLELLRATKEGVSAVDPDVPVMTALSPSRDSQTTRAELFLHDLYNLGAGDVIDAIGTNLYASTNRSVDDPQNWFNQYLWWMRYVKWVHSAPEQIWITESGYYTKSPGTAPGCQDGWVSEDFQADQLARAIRHVSAMPDVSSYFIHRPRDSGQLASCDREHHFGLTRLDGSRKPAWAAVQSELAAP